MKLTKGVDKWSIVWYSIDRKKEIDKIEREVIDMMMNVWRSIYTGEVYEMPMDWMPKFEGWELVGTVEK